MSNNKDQQEPAVPTSNVGTRSTSELLPRFYRTDSNKKFLQATLDQLTQPGTVKKINGYIGRQNAKAVSNSDIFLDAVEKTRKDYQLEPAAIIKDYLGNTTFFKDYIDHINHISVFDGITSNHSRINKQEFYSWNPHICWDKFTNYQNYYWLPFGPDPITVSGQQRDIESTYTVSSIDEGDNTAFIFTPSGLTKNPTLKLYRGQTYKFDISSSGHPFSIKTSKTSGTTDRYTLGVSKNSVETGVMVFSIPLTAPDVLYYVSDNSIDTAGVFQIYDIDDNTVLNLDTDFIGKKSYIIPGGKSAGVSISNGMKLQFSGQVYPQQYSSGFWYVEGVGTAIKLTSELDLEVRSTYTEDQTLLFDDLPFDQLPFSETGSYPSKKDYITINRSSIDSNPWSRYNRWFHQDVVMTSARMNGSEPVLDQNSRATRPIIEFNPNIKLHNYGIISKKQVDVIDNYTKDVFSTIEGSTGYNIDGIDLSAGMRVLFNADTDPIVTGKIYLVNFIDVRNLGKILAFDASTELVVSTNSIKFTASHGLRPGARVYYDSNGNSTIPGLIDRKIYYVNVINPTTLTLFFDKNLTRQVVIPALSTGTHNLEVYAGTRRQINLVEAPDSVPAAFETVSVRFGRNELVSEGIVGNQGQSYWYDGVSWKISQIKYSINQPPKFDIFDSDGNSFSNLSVYEGSTFSGCNIFTYKIGNGTVDSELGFPIQYQNINNIGDIVFNFDLLTDSFSYKEQLSILNKSTDVGYLKISNSLESHLFENAWVISNIRDSQPVVRVYKNSGLLNDFPIDMFDDILALTDLRINVYINGKRIPLSDFSVLTIGIRKFVRLINPVSLADVVSIKCFTKQAKNDNGFYELPINLQNNPLNDSIERFTLGQVVDHVDSIIENYDSSIDISKLRDYGNLSKYGTRFVQHSSPLNLALYHLGSKSSNILKAVSRAREDYSKFKRAFLVAASDSGIDTDPKNHVDYILLNLFKDSPRTSPYYLSDMFAYSASSQMSYTVLDSRIKVYPLSKPFNLQTLSNTAVSLYLNGVQLLHGKDYVFGDDVFFTVLADIQPGDIIDAFEYETTDGCFCPPTPTKLGIFPKFEPMKYLDTSYLEPTEVIQGHDGSITVAFGDYRDELLLELEKRIFNNIKVEYNADIFDIYSIIPGYNRSTEYTKSEFDKVLSKYFFQWAVTVPQDYTKHTVYDRLNAFTFNYRGSYSPDGQLLPASWRGIYQWLLDTSRPHTHPWECMGMSIKPQWWESVYGPAPYTSDNLILWNDIKGGVIRKPGSAITRLPRFAKSILEYGVPVDQSGNLIDPISAGYANGNIRSNDSGYFEFGDQHTVESAWRKSSNYPFAFLETAILLHPSYVLGTTFDRSRIVKNLSNQLVYSDTGLRIRLDSISLPSTATRTINNRLYTSGLVNYIVEYLTGENVLRLGQYAEDLKQITNNLTTRISAFTSKPKYKFLLDSKTPSTQGGVFVPEENYSIELNVSSATKKVSYSGIMITKFADGFEIKGYNTAASYFNYYDYMLDDRVIRVGGISESFSRWASSKTYVAGKIVQVGNQYYRVRTTHVSGLEFDPVLYIKLPELPIIGGREVMLRKGWDSSEIKTLAYGTRLETVQEVSDFIQGYGAYLAEQGFVFDDFNNNLGAISNWETSIKEFLFWTSQGWGEGAILAMSPAANRLVFNSDLSVVEDLTDPFYGYNIYRVDGQKLDPEFIKVYRNKTEFVLEPDDTVHGIYSATLFLVQKEHVAILDDVTLFNDTIYDKPAGYRQQRVNVIGYVTSNWTGGFEIPGFVYDQAVIKGWESWTDYSLGDVVKHKEFYYGAKRVLSGAAEFDENDWQLLPKKPVAALLPNLDYKAEQFTDFYDLDTDNFDVDQQRIAQHLIGYQSRQYLENIIKNDVSQYKFYQGMITEKGTHNVLSKLFDVFSADDKDSLTFDEEWAFRIGEYGALDTFDEIELLLDESKFRLNPQPIELVKELQEDTNNFVYKQRLSDIYIKPKTLTSNIWSTKDKIPYLRSAGFVRKEDIQINVDTLDKLIGTRISDSNSGNYIWTAFEGIGWNVYRITPVGKQISISLSNSNIVTISSNTSLSISIGDVVGITSNVNSLNGYYKVTSATDNSFSINVTGISSDSITSTSTAAVYAMRPHLYTSIDQVNAGIDFKLTPGELVWVKESNIGKNAVYKNTPIYTRSEIVNSPASKLILGHNISITDSGNISAVIEQSGITVYAKGNAGNNWASIDRIDRPGANIVKFSRDGVWLAVAESADVSGVIYLYTRLISGRYALADTIVTSNAVSDVIFGKRSDAGYILAVSFDSLPNILYYSSTNWQSPTAISLPDGVISSAIAMSSDAASLVVSSHVSGRVLIYKLINGMYSLLQTVSTDDYNETAFGTAVSISDNSLRIAVSAPNAGINGLSYAGQVIIYKLVDGEYTRHQVLVSTRRTSYENFGMSLQFMNGGNSLAIMARGLSDDVVTTFDELQATFDDASLTFIDRAVTGRYIDIYDTYLNDLVYGETLSGIVLDNIEHSVLVAGTNTVLLSSLNPTISKIYSYNKPANKFSWEPFRVQSNKVDVSSIKKSFLYNKVTNKLIANLDVVDVTQGKIPGIADQEIKYKTYFDPAVYSVGLSTLRVDPGMSWAAKYVGMVWWDLTNAKFLNTETADVAYNVASWNSLYDTASIDVYEWVESKLKPDAWDAVSDTVDGLARGISGKSKYGSSVYSVSRKYDTISQTFKETYYYWVTNKKTTPDIEGRTLSVSNISRLIADPAGYGYSCILFTGSNSMGLVNVDKYLEDTNTVLNIQYWVSDSRESNYHTEWKLLSTNRNTRIPQYLETKWFDSLVGKDTQNRTVPDLSLPIKQRYGVESRPRQSMFVNRLEAVKQLITRVNSVLSTRLITDSYNLSALSTYETPPSAITGKWDSKVESFEELRFIQTSVVSSAIVSPVIQDGQVVNITVLSPGVGYNKSRVYDSARNLWYGPDIFIAGKGKDASIKSLLNSAGAVVGAEILSKGYGYEETASASIRDYSVLVTSDSNSANRWSIYSWDSAYRRWNKTKVQGFDVTNYWEYLDWYASGYNQFVKIDYLFNNTYELVTTDIPVGTISKIKNIGTGGWVLLEKVNSIQTIDYTENFIVIGREKGTIQFLDSLYNFQQGYDRLLHDSALYDNDPTAELRIILDTLRDNILVDELRTEYLKLFFSNIRYVFHEQTFVDWALKTSFVKAMHNVGELKQKVTYSNDNLEYYEQYINEVKPYRTKVREFISAYDKLELSNTGVSDFDILPIIDEQFKVTPLTVKINTDGVLESEYSQLLSDPWKNWVDNVGFEIREIKVVNQGTGYLTPPVISITGTQLAGGQPASAKAYITNGQLNRIDLINGGSKWVSAPTVSIAGGLSVQGTPAKAVAIIGNSVIRNSYVKVKFDRISKTYEITSLLETEQFSGVAVTGSRTQFPLKWRPSSAVGSSKVFVNGAELLQDSYTVSSVESFDGSRYRYTGILQFINPPALGSIIVVEYLKDVDMLSAADRINFYYNPGTGQLGKELSQLMTGIDYGGVSITGIGFGEAVGWDTDLWNTTGWDDFDVTFSDYTVTVNPITYSFTIPYTPEVDEEVNIYVSRFISNDVYSSPVRIDDIDFSTANQKNNDAVMKTFVGDGTVNVITLPSTVGLQLNDRVIFRKKDSDGSYIPSDTEYDTVLEAGNLEYSSATGLLPDDIILDGDDFVTANTSHAPEEFVPGQVVDTLAIKVYTRPSGGSPNIMFKTHIGDGATVSFIIGQTFPNSDSIIVKVDDIIQSKSEYTIDYETNRVILNSIPLLGSRISIISISYSSANILDLDYFISDGDTLEYITKANWVIGITSTVLVNGISVPYQLFKTDDTYTFSNDQQWRSRVGIRFSTAPPLGAVITYIVDTSDVDNSASIVKSENISYIEGTDTYQLVNPVGVDAPLEPNVIVKIGNRILTPPSVNYFNIEKGKRSYSLKDHKYIDQSLNSSDIAVYLGSTLLSNGTGYTVKFSYAIKTFNIVEGSIRYLSSTGYTVGDILQATSGTVTAQGASAKFEVTQVTDIGGITELVILDRGDYTSPVVGPIQLIGGTGEDAQITCDFALREYEPNITIKLARGVGVPGEKLSVVVKKSSDYFISNGELTLNSQYSTGSLIEIMSFYNHNILKIERSVDTLTSENSILAGTIDHYELVDKLGGYFNLRHPAVSGDFVWVIKNGELLINNVDYILELNTTIKLAVSNKPNDIIQIIAFTNTVVTDNFAYMQFKDMLNRVHYKRLRKDKTTRLAMPLLQTDTEIVVVNAMSLDIPNPAKNLPGIIEINGERIEYFIKNGNTLGQLRRSTLGTSMPTEHASGMLVQGIGSSETIPYIDNYIVTTVDPSKNNNSTTYINGIVELPYSLEIDALTLNSYQSLKDTFEVFVGGYRLKKNDYVLYQESNGYPYSPAIPLEPSADSKEGDSRISAEFGITGDFKLQLSELPIDATGTKLKVLVVKRQGKLWNDSTKRLVNSNNTVANFVTEFTTAWPE